MDYAPVYWMLTIRKEEFVIDIGNWVSFETFLTKDSPLEYLAFFKQDDLKQNARPGTSQNTTIVMCQKFDGLELLANGFGVDGELLEKTLSKETSLCATDPVVAAPVPPPAANVSTTAPTSPPRKYEYQHLASSTRLSLALLSLK